MPVPRRRFVQAPARRDSAGTSPLAGEGAGCAGGKGRGDRQSGHGARTGTHMRNTPKRVSCSGAFSEAEMASASTMRVSAGSMTPSSHKRAEE